MKRMEVKTGRRVRLKEINYECSEKNNSLESMQLVYSDGFKSQVFGKASGIDSNSKKH